MADERIERGLATIKELFPDPSNIPGGNFSYPAEIKDDWNALAVSTVMGDVWGRPGLPKKNRAMITIAALTVLGRQEQLKVYIAAALNLGLTRSEICEVIFQMAVYGGFPAAISALESASAVFEQHAG